MYDCMKKEFYITGRDGIKLAAVRWVPASDPIGVIQIVHGLTEHMDRYDTAARRLVSLGYVVTGNDIRGHGDSMLPGQGPAYIGPEGSWEDLVSDMEILRDLTRESYPELPFYYLGFSLGSFIVRTGLIRHPGGVDGAILAGTGRPEKSHYTLRDLVCRLESRRLDPARPAKLCRYLMFDAKNRRFRSHKTPVDWLCSNEEAIGNLMTDPRCHIAMTPSLFREYVGAMKFTGEAKNIQQMDPEVPLLLISGEEDVSGEYGKAIHKLYALYLQAGIRSVNKVLYPHMRHDIFHEYRWEEVIEDIHRWIVSCRQKRYHTISVKGEDFNMTN